MLNWWLTPLTNHLAVSCDLTLNLISCIGKSGSQFGCCHFKLSYIFQLPPEPSAIILARNLFSIRSRAFSYL